MTVAQSRVLRVATWVAARSSTPALLVLTLVKRGSYHRFHPDLIHALITLCPRSWWWRAARVYACVEGKGRSRRIVAVGALALLPLVVAWLWWWD